MKEKITGLVAPTLTCFSENEMFDEEATRNHVSFLMEHDVDAIMPCATAGEVTSLSMDEYKKVIKAVIEEVDHKMPVLAGATDSSTKLAIERSKFAEDSGADGVMIAPPLCQLATEKEVYQYFKDISEPISIPIVLYNSPELCGVDVQPRQIAKMANEGIISYVKESTGDTSRIGRILEHTEGNITVYYGMDNHPLGGFVAGAKGWIGGAMNFFPREIREIYTLCVEKHDYVGAKKAWAKLLPFVNLLTYSDTNERPNWIQFIKEGLELRGKRVGKARRPLLPLEQSDKDRLKKVLESMGLLGE